MVTLVLWMLAGANGERCSAPDVHPAWCIRESYVRDEGCTSIDVLRDGHLQVVAPRTDRVIARHCPAAGDTTGAWQFGVQDEASGGPDRYVAYVERDLEPSRLQVSSDHRWMTIAFASFHAMRSYVQLWKLPEMTLVELPDALELIDIGPNDAIGRWYGPVPGRPSPAPMLIRATTVTRVRIALPPSKKPKFLEADRTVWSCWRPCPESLPTGSTEAEGRWRARH